MRKTFQTCAALDSAPPSAAQLLDLEEIAADRFRARFNLDNLAGRAFGGQLLGQALAAAARTAPAWPATQASAIFLRSGKLDRPLDYAVERVNQGRTFAQRRVVAWQDGRAVFDLLCSFHAGEKGPSHQFPQLPDVPGPEALDSVAKVAANIAAWPQSLRHLLTLPFPIELRPAKPELMFAQTDRPASDMWMRIPTAAHVTTAADQQALLLVLSDYWLAGAAKAPHADMNDDILITSLNHSIWLHGPARMDEWVLFHVDSDWAGGGRGLARGSILTRDGRLIATVMQEVLLRRV